MPPHVLLFTASDRVVHEVVPALTNAGCACASLAADEDLWRELAHGGIDLLVADRRLLGPEPAAAVAEVRGLLEAPEIVVLIDTDEVIGRAELLAAGAFAVLSRETPGEELSGALATLANRATARRTERVLAVAQSEAPELGMMVSKNSQMTEFLQFVRRVAPSDSSLLLLGETGVGKEYLAKAIHGASDRSRGPFVPVNCAALSESLLESELFGHVKGAFTGAANYRRGYFELAHGGTLFLDEVGELSPALQVKLLRGLQERKVRPVGGEHLVEVDVRLMAATNRDLIREMEQKRFRADLYYRLSVISLQVPPLRIRVEDLPDLIGELIRKSPTAAQRGIQGVDASAMEVMTKYAWPGNVRELMNVIERAVLLAANPEITVSDLPFGTDRDRAVGAAVQQGFSGELFAHARSRMLSEFEQTYLRALLRHTRGRLTAAAKLADMNPRSLYEKMKQYKLSKADFRLLDAPGEAQTENQTST